MGTSEACLHLLSGQGIWNPSLKSNPCMGMVNFAPCSKWLKNSRVKRFHMGGIGGYPMVKPRLSSCFDVRRKLDGLSCKCLRDDRNVRTASSGLDGPLHIRETEKSSPGSTNGTINPSVDQVISGKTENVRAKVDSIEDEAWELLRESIVNYCGNPVGTIAANEPNSSNLLNYDQVFIRDFIPSGIAFLLKEEYDIVRNFLLHTLQLQVKYDLLCFDR